MTELLQIFFVSRLRFLTSHYFPGIVKTLSDIVSPDILIFRKEGKA